MPFGYIFEELWRWLAHTGINLALLILLALLIPRAGRFANRIVEKKITQSMDNDEGKTHLALANVGINIAQILAFFLLLVFFLQQVGFSLAGAAIPATVVSAAIGFGAQSIIADFLAGFFILTEKQYGVGDWVSFDISGTDVEGTVIQITMRSTYIRTLEDATVSVPNSTARVCINYSNYWSSAKVVIPVPLLSSQNTAEVIQRAERAARRAIAQPEVAKNLLGDLDVHPAVGVNPPTTVGMPWTMDMRFLIRVEPLSQWMVERAIRIQVLDEFWSEYGSAPTVSGTRLDHVVDHTHVLGAMTSPSANAPTEVLAPELPEATAAGIVGPHSTRLLPIPGEGAPGASSDNSEATRAAEAEHDPATDSLSDDTSGTFAPRTLFGGTMRLSTGVLLGAFLVLLIIRGLTLGPAEGSEGKGGVLAPPPRPAVTSTHNPAPQPAPKPTAYPAPTSTLPTVEQSPTGTVSSTPATPDNPQEPQNNDSTQAPPAPQTDAGRANAPQPAQPPTVETPADAAQ